jgi:hypothetical protein
MGTSLRAGRSEKWLKKSWWKGKKFCLDNQEAWVVTSNSESQDSKPSPAYPIGQMDREVLATK